MTSAVMLEHWGRAHIKSSRFLGVFPADRLPAPDGIEPPSSVVLNYDPADMPGSHWVTMLVQPSSVSWFDSYGLGPDSPDLLLGHRTNFRVWISRVCQRLGLSNYGFSRVDLQSPGEATCGHWAVYFAKNGPEMGWESFGNNREKNDRLIRRLVRFDLHKSAASM